MGLFWCDGGSVRVVTRAVYWGKFLAQEGKGNVTGLGEVLTDQKNQKMGGNLWMGKDRCTNLGKTGPNNMG